MKRRLAITTTLIICCLSLILPQQVYAFNLFRELYNGIRHTTRFVVRLPDKATRWMGPVIGPIASDIIAVNLGKNPKFGSIFIKANRTHNIIQNIEEQKKVVKELQTAYRDQANEFRNTANSIRQTRKDLAQNLVNGDITWDNYKQQVLDLERIADTYDQAASKFDQAAGQLKPSHITNTLSSNLVNQFMGQVSSAVIKETSREFEKYIHPEVIQTLLTQKNVSFDDVLDIIIEKDVQKLLNRSDYQDIDKDDLKDRIRDNIKQIIKDNKDALKYNWQEEINKVINQSAEELRHIKENLPDVPTSPPDPSSTPTPENSQNTSDLEDLFNSDDSSNTTSNSKCAPGYEYKPNMGRECIQANCSTISDGHLSYTGDCICGSSGSINENPDDPNKECSYDSSFTNCPGCLYACVHLNEDCPKMP